MNKTEPSYTKANTAVICLSPYQGGMELDALHLAKMFSHISEVTLIAKKDHFIANTFLASKEQYGVHLKTISFKSSFSLSIIKEVRQIAQEGEIKNVLFLGASELKSLYFAFLGLDINLIIRHGTTKSSPKKDWFHRLIYSKVNYHVGICEHIAKNIRYIIPFSEQTQLKVIYPSLNLQPTQAIDYDAKPHQPLTLLHVGRIAEGKGQKAAIEACDLLYKNGIDFIFYIVGGYHEPYQEGFEQFVRELPYHDKIHLVGHTKAVEAYYLKSDIFLFPSDGEGLSNAFIEAMCYGLAGITYDNTSFPELQRLGFHFSCVEDQDQTALERTLLESAQHYDLYKEKTADNAKLSQTLFTQERELKDLEAILR